MSLDKEATETPITVKEAARFLGVSPSLVYAYVERKQIPHYRMMGRSIRFRLSELAEWRQQFHVNGGIDEQEKRKTEDPRGEHLPTQGFRVLVDALPGPGRKASEGIDGNRR